jgi:hypothetical protein
LLSLLETTHAGRPAPAPSRDNRTQVRGSCNPRFTQHGIVDAIT